MSCIIEYKEGKPVLNKEVLNPLIKFIAKSLKISVEKNEIPQVDKQIRDIYEFVKKNGGSEQFAADAARVTPILIFKIFSNDYALYDKLDSLNPKFITDTVSHRKKFREDDSKLTNLYNVVKFKKTTPDAEQVKKTSKKLAEKKEKKPKVVRPLTQVFTAIRTFAQEFFNYERPDEPGFLEVKPEYKRQGNVKKILDSALDEQIIEKGIEDSSQLLYPGMKKPGVFLRVISGSVLYNEFYEDLKGTDARFLTDEKLVGVLVDSDGNPIKFDEQGNYNESGKIAYYKVEDDALRLPDGKIVTSQDEFNKYWDWYTTTDKYNNFSQQQKVNEERVQKQIFKRFNNRIQSILDEQIENLAEGEELASDAKIIAIQQLESFYNNLSSIRNYIALNSGNYVDNVIVKSDKGFIVNNMWKPTPLSKVDIPSFSYTIVTTGITSDSDLVLGNTYISYPGIDQLVTVLRTPLISKPEISDSIVSFFTDVLYKRSGTKIVPMTMADRIGYIEQFVTDQITNVKFLSYKVADKKERVFIKEVNGENFVKLKVGNKEFEFKFDDTAEDVQVRQEAAEAIKNIFSTPYVKYNEDGSSYNKEFNDKNKERVIESAKKDGAKVIISKPATEDKSKAKAIQEALDKTLKENAGRPITNTIIAYPTGEKDGKVDYEYFYVYYPTMSIMSSMQNQDYSKVESREGYKGGFIVDFATKDNNYNEFVRNNFSTAAVVNNSGKIVLVNPSISFNPVLSEVDKVNKASQEELIKKEEEQKAEKKTEEEVKAQKNEQSNNDTPSINPEDIDDSFLNNRNFFDKSSSQRANEKRATNLQNLKALVWYVGDSAARTNPDFKKFYNRLSESEKKELSEFAKSIPEFGSPLSKYFSFKTMHSAVNTTAGKPSAQWVNNAIILYSYFNKTTKEASELNLSDIYHEAWHGFTQTFLTQKERDALYDETSKKQGSFMDYAGNYVTFAKATKKQLDEFLAEDFREYMLSGGKVTDKSAPSKNSLFRRILNFLKELFGTSKPADSSTSPTTMPKVAELYAKLSKGDLSNYNFSIQNIDQTMGKFYSSLEATDPNEQIDFLGYEDANKLVGITDSIISSYSSKLNKKYSEKLQRDIYSFSTELMKSAKDAATVYTVVKSEMRNILESLEKRIAGDPAAFIEQALKLEGVTYTKEQIDALGKTIFSPEEGAFYVPEASLDKVFTLTTNQRDSLYKTILSEIAKIGNEYETNQLLEASKLIQYAINNFGDTENIMNNRDGKGLIAYHQKKSKYLSSEDKDLSFDDIDDSKSADNAKDNAYSDQTGKQSQFDVANQDVHYLLAGIHAYDENNKPVVNIFGVQELTDKRTVWNRTARVLQGSLTPTEMFETLTDLSNELVRGEGYDPILKELLNKLGPFTPNITAVSASVWINFFYTFSMVNNPLWQVNIERTEYEYGPETFTSYDVKVGSANSIQRKVRNVWNNKFKVTDSEYIRRNRDREDEENFDSKYLDVAAVIVDFGKNGLLRSNSEFDFFRAIGVVLSNKPEIRRAITASSRNLKPVGNAGEIYRKLVKMYDRGIDKIYSLNDIFDEVPGDEDYPTLPSDNSRYSDLADLETRYSDYASNYIVSNAAGNSQYELTKQSTLTSKITLINKVGSLRELFNYRHMRYLDPKINPASTSSLLLNSIFDVDDYLADGEGARRVINGDPNKFNIGNVAGIAYIDSDGGSVGVESAKADRYGKLALDFHSTNILNRNELMRAADKGSSFSFWADYILGGSNDGKFFVDPVTFIKNENNEIDGFNSAAQILLGYLDSEMKRISILKDVQQRIKNGEQIEYDTNYLKEGQKFYVFEDILPYKSIQEILLNYSSLDEASVKYPDIKNQVIDEIVNYFTKYYFSSVKGLFSSENTFISDELVEETIRKANEKGYNTEFSGARNALIRSYLVNNWIYNYESTVLIFGDIAQYKFPKEEFHKRNAGAQSAGDMIVTDPVFINWVNNKTALANGAVSYSKKLKEEDPSIDVLTINTDGSYNTVVFKENLIASNPKIIAEIREAISEDEYTKAENKLKSLKGEKLEKFKKELEKKIDKIIKPYTELEEGNAQGYANFDFYRQLSYLLGIWSNEQDNLFTKIVNKEKVDRSDVAKFFPPLKIQLWGSIDTGKLPPLNGFHKYNVIPLIPTLIEGKSIEAIHKKMIKENIGIATFESGSKISTITKIDRNGNAIRDKFYTSGREVNDSDEPYTKNVVFLQDLKKQVAIAPTYKEESTFPTQMRKLIERGMFLDGVPTDFMPGASSSERMKEWSNNKDKSKSSEYYKYVKAYENDIKAITDLRMSKLEKKLFKNKKKMDVDKDGNVILHPELKKFLKDELERQDLGDHEKAFLTEMKGVLTSDLSLSLSAEKLEKVLNSIIVKKLVRQKLNGEPLFQVATTGFELRTKLTEEEKEKFQTNDLPYYMRTVISVDKNGKKTYGKTLAAKAKIALQGDFYNLLYLKHLDGKEIGTIDRLNAMIQKDEWLDIDNHRDMLTIIGPRIPTQENNSMEFVEIYEFLDESAGNIVILPSEIVAKSGGDFDADKVTFIYPSFKVKETEDGKSVTLNTDRNTEGGLVNSLLQNMKSILELPVNYISLVTPNDTTIAKNIADKIANATVKYNPRERYQTDVNPDTAGRLAGTKVFEVPYNLEKHQSNNIGKIILGIIAVANNYSALFNRIGFYMNHSYKSGKQERVQTIRLPHNTLTIDDEQVISLAGLYDVYGENSIANVISQLINGSVDVAKDDWIFYLSANEELIPTFLFMIQAGVPLETTVNFLSHPLVKAYVEKRQALSSVVSAPTSGIFITDEAQIKREARNFILGDPKYNIEFDERMLGKFGGPLIYKKTQSLFNNKVIKSILKPETINSYLFNRATMDINKYETQVSDQALFLHFLELENMAGAITNFMQTTNFDTNPSMTIFDAITKEDDLNELRNTGRYPAKFVDAIIDESPIGSFNIQKFQSSVFAPLFKLRQNNTIMDYFKYKVSSEDFKKLKAKTGLKDGELVNQLLNDLNGFIFQNSLNQLDLDNITSYKGINIEDSVKVIKRELNGLAAYVKEVDGKPVLYLDKTELRREYEELTTNGAKGLVKNVKMPDGYETTLAGVLANMFPTPESYYKFVIEREIVRSIYPGKEGYRKLLERKDVQKRRETYLNETEREEGESLARFTRRVDSLVYETALRNIAMDNIYNVNKMFKSGVTMADQFNDILEDYPELLKNYSILKNMSVNIGENIKGSNGKKIKRIANIAMDDITMDSDKINVYHENLRKLSDPGAIKINTDNVEERRRVADFFKRFSIFAFFQSGLNTTGMYSFVRVVPQEGFQQLMKTMSKNFLDNINYLTLDNFVSKATEVYSSYDNRVRFKDWAISDYNPVADKFLTDKVKMQAVSEGVTNTVENILLGARLQRAQDVKINRDEFGNILYEGDAATSVDQINSVVGKTVAFPSTIEINITKPEGKVPTEARGDMTFEQDQYKITVKPDGSMFYLNGTQVTDKTLQNKIKIQIERRNGTLRVSNHNKFNYFVLSDNTILGAGKTNFGKESVTDPTMREIILDKAIISKDKC